MHEGSERSRQSKAHSVRERRGSSRSSGGIEGKVRRRNPGASDKQVKSILNYNLVEDKFVSLQEQDRQSTLPSEPLRPLVADSGFKRMRQNSLPAVEVRLRPLQSI
jgi:hypothetical protein